VFSSIVYQRSPPVLQEALITSRAFVRARIREGKLFRQYLNEIQTSEFQNTSELGQYQTLQLSALLEHAVSTVPFYRAVSREAISKLRAQGPGELLTDFPMIDKTAVRDAASQIYSTERRAAFTGYTSGTTGSPLTVKQDLAAICREKAFAWRQLIWAGYRPGDRRAWIRGDMVVPVWVRSSPYWRQNFAEKMLMMSSYHLSEESAASYVSALGQFDPHIIQAYPSSIEFLARHVLASGREYAGASLRAIVTSSESLSSDQRSLLEAAFRCPVFDWYGQLERVAAIGTCEKGRYHLLSDYSYVELLPTGQGTAEIVGTGFSNWCMPLIRYRTGDHVELPARQSACECGRSFPIIERVIGRREDVVKLPDGRVIGRLDHIFKGVTGILEAQIRQDEPDRVRILVVAAVPDTEQIRKRLTVNAHERLGTAVVVEVHFVSAIARSPNGKLQGVVCNV
jgi:phenylacetate-CoA ligase